MERPVNIYSAIAFDLHPKIKTLIDELNQAGQIDHDDHGHPFIIAVDPVGKNNYRIDFIRAGRQENILLNTRKRGDPIRSFKHDDGFKRMDIPRLPTVIKKTDGRRERTKRTTFESLVEQMIRTK